MHKTQVKQKAWSKDKDFGNHVFVEIMSFLSSGHCLCSFLLFCCPSVSLCFKISILTLSSTPLKVLYFFPNPYFFLFFFFLLEFPAVHTDPFLTGDCSGIIDQRRNLLLRHHFSKFMRL